MHFRFELFAHKTTSYFVLALDVYTFYHAATISSTLDGSESAGDETLGQCAHASKNNGLVSVADRFAQRSVL